MKHPDKNSEVSSEVKMSRRRLLKLLAATGGAAAGSAMLPGKWTKPLVEVGVLPAHAQASPLLTISDLEAACSSDFADPNSDERPKGIVEADGGAQFNYSDPAGMVDDTSTLDASILPCGEMVFDGQSVGDLSPGIVSGTPSNGTIRFFFNTSTAFCNRSCGAEDRLTVEIDPAELEVQLFADGRPSNVLKAPIVSNAPI